MVHKHLLIREDQNDLLKKLPGNDNEHIRRALDEYLKKMTPKATISPSKKGGDYGQSRRIQPSPAI